MAMYTLADHERETEERNRRREEAIASAKERILASLFNDRLEDFGRYDLVGFETHYAGDLQCWAHKLTVQKKEPGLLIKHVHCQEWADGQRQEDTAELQPEDTEKSLQLFRLLCKEAYESAKYGLTAEEDEARQYGTESSAVLRSGESEIPSRFITVDMVAILSFWLGKDVLKPFVDVITEDLTGFPVDGITVREPDKKRW